MNIMNLNYIEDLQLTEGNTDMETDSMDTCLERFFNNVLKCIVLDENVFCTQE